MKIEIDQLSNNSDAAHISRLMHEFISQKMTALGHVEQTEQADAVSLENVYRKYHASLLMLFHKLNIMNKEEIARLADITYEMLDDWDGDELFQQLVSWHYRGFLEFVVDLFA